MSTTESALGSLIGTMVPWLVGLAALSLIGEWLAPPARARRRRRTQAQTDEDLAFRISLVAAMAFGLGLFVPAVRWSLYVAAAPGLLAALFWWRIVQRRQAFARTGLTRADLQRLSPTDFERWCAARLREQGYSVQEVGRQGDHGIDLIAERGGERTIVQCKRWNSGRAIGEPQIRDLYGTMHDAEADRAMVITTGLFTEAASAWAEGKPILLWDVDRVVGDARPLATAQAVVTLTPTVPICQRDGSTMVKRVNHSDGSTFWGCPNFPRCRYTRRM